MNDFEQISILVEPEKSAYEKIKPFFLKILRENGLQENLLTDQMRKEYYSVTFDKSVVFRIYNKSAPYISVPQYATLKEVFPGGHVLKDGYVRFSLKSLEEIEQYKSLLEHVFHEVLDSVPNEFDCCSRVNACSDAKMCIHPDKKLAFKCGYRKILKSGRIFYGKNRNIE